jgi:hypothetical protein
MLTAFSASVKLIVFRMGAGFPSAVKAINKKIFKNISSPRPFLRKFNALFSPPHPRFSQRRAEITRASPEKMRTKPKSCPERALA